jgi:hypothetical protein
MLKVVAGLSIPAGGAETSLAVDFAPSLNLSAAPCAKPPITWPAKGFRVKAVAIGVITLLVSPSPNSFPIEPPNTILHFNLSYRLHAARLLHQTLHQSLLF